MLTFSVSQKSTLAHNIVDYDVLRWDNKDMIFLLWEWGFKGGVGGDVCVGGRGGSGLAETM